MRLVSGVKYDDLLYRYQRVCEARDEAEKTAADRLSTITRQAQEITQLREQPAAGQAHSSRKDWRLLYEAERKRADRLQRELDAALGLDKGVPVDSAPWQPAFKTPKPDTKGATS